MKTINSKASYKVADFLLTAGIIMLGGAIAGKALSWATGDEIRRIHPFDKDGQKGIVVQGDTFLRMMPKRSLINQPK
jgi:hypothetical protein